MTTQVERTSEVASPDATSSALIRFAPLTIAPLGTAAVVAAAIAGWDGGLESRAALFAVTVSWGAAAIVLVRRGDTRLGLLASWLSALAGVSALAAAISDGERGGDVAALAEALTVALLPAATLHVLLALPSGRLPTRRSALTVAAGYVVAGAVGTALWLDAPSPAAWPVVLESIVAAGVGVSGALARYRGVQGPERVRMHCAALAIALGAELMLAALTLRVLVGWPKVAAIPAAGLVPLAVALIAWTSVPLRRIADRLVVSAVSLVGLTALVVAVYLLLVVGLGRPPSGDERTVLALSMVAAAISAILFVPARERLAGFSNRLVHGERQSADELVRTFGARLSRAVPLEELLLQLAESLQWALALEAAEIWTGSDGVFERVVSEPDRGTASLRLTEAEAAVVARTGVSGPARSAVWLPQLLADRGVAAVGVVPVTDAGELLGFIVVERATESEPLLDDEGAEVVAGLARQLGLVLRNVRLDSELQASLEDLRRQADELRASRARVVAAADAERRRIERDLHDGAQQYLVGLAANLGAVRELMPSDPDRANAVLHELQDSIGDAMQAFRDLAHGIYPPLLQDRGLADALANAARGSTIPTRVDAAGLRRYSADVEATVYFCCLEALQNAAKHAGSRTRATVRVWEEEGGLLFEIADDGVGLDPAQTMRGVGLTNMEDRLASVGGSLRIQSAPGRGTRVLGAVPLQR